MRKIIPLLLVAQLGLLTIIGISCANSIKETSQEESGKNNNDIYYVVKNESSDTLVISVSGQIMTMDCNKSYAIPMGTIFFIINNKSYPYYLDSNLTVNAGFLAVLIR
jgi:hypothetical protein